MKHVLALLGGLTVLSALPATLQAASNCPAGSFVLNAGQAFAAASRSGSASAFIGAASRYADTRSIALSALGIHRKKLSRADEGEYVRLAQAFMGRFMARHASKFNVSGLKVTTCSANIVSATSSGGKKVIFRVGKGRGGYRVQDVNVSSIWLAGQMRTTFVGVLNSNNGDIRALMKYLRG
jgi:ABC-type transporter MlaC component